MRRIGLLKDTHKSNNGSWYDLLETISNKKSVVFAEFFDTTSSCGDWSGVIIQKLGNGLYCRAFTQENNYPRGGFTITLGRVYYISYIKGCDYRNIADKIWRIESM